MFVLKRVKKTIARVMSVKETEVLSKASFADSLGADSLDHAALLQALELEFDILIPNSDAEKLQTVEDTVKYVESKVSGKEGKSKRSIKE
jgi:acyl carrier protein